jgi:hypothetical protein
LRVYDTSGPYTDAAIQTDIARGLAPHRQAWIMARGDVEQIAGRAQKPEDDGLKPGEARRVPLRWNNVAMTLGVGYDIQLAEYLWLRPILNGSLGYATSDASLFGAFVNWRTGRDVSPLTNQHMNVRGLGGSLVLAYYDYRPARDIDVELRYTQIQLESFGDTPQGIGGTSTARTLGLWARYRWPTGLEAFGRPLRWVIDTSASAYLGDQREALGFAWSVKVGGGIEFDIGRQEFGALGLTLSRVRLIGRYFYGDGGITGTSFGIGMSF